MANSILDALLAYMVSIFPVLASVIKRFDRIRRNFLGKVVETRKILSEMGGADSGKEGWRGVD